MQKTEKKESLTSPVTTLSFPLTGAIGTEIKLERNVKSNISTSQKYDKRIYGFLQVEIYIHLRHSTL